MDPDCQIAPKIMHNPGLLGTYVASTTGGHAQNYGWVTQKPAKYEGGVFLKWCDGGEWEHGHTVKRIRQAASVTRGAAPVLCVL